MPFSDSAGRLDQIVYRDTGHPLLPELAPGVGPAASSFEDEEELRHWHGKLKGRVTGGHPYPSLCYLVIGDSAALMYRDTDQKHRDSPFAHVLIGRRACLPAWQAPRLHAWEWHGAIKPADRVPGKLPPVSENPFPVNNVRYGLDTLKLSDTRSQGVNKLIIDVFREEGATSPPLGDKRFAIFTDESPKLAIGLLIEMMHALGDETFIRDGFSTHENKYNDGEEGLPRFVFVTRKDQGSYAITRTVIDLRGIDGQPGVRNMDLAADRIAQYRLALGESADKASQQNTAPLNQEWPAPAEEEDTSPPDQGDMAPSDQGATEEQDPDADARLGGDPGDDAIGPDAAADPGSARQERDDITEGAGEHGGTDPTARFTDLTQLTPEELFHRHYLINLNNIGAATQVFLSGGAAMKERPAPGTPPDAIDARAREASRLRAGLISAKFGAPYLNRLIGEPADLTALYEAMVRLAVAGEKQPFSHGLEGRLTEILAGNDVVRSETKWDAPAPLAKAIGTVLWPPDGRIPHDQAAAVYQAIGTERARFLGIQEEEPPPSGRQEGTERAPVRRFTIKDGLLALVVVLGLAIVAVIVGSA